MAIATISLSLRRGNDLVASMPNGFPSVRSSPPVVGIQLIISRLNTTVVSDLYVPHFKPSSLSATYIVKVLLELGNEI